MADRAYPILASTGFALLAITSSIHPDAVTHIEPCRYGRGSNLLALITAPLVDGEYREPAAPKSATETVVRLVEPIAYGRYIARLANLLGGGVIVQRLGDLLAGRRSTPERIARSVVQPTLASATPGDLSFVLPYRYISDITEMLQAMDRLLHGGIVVLHPHRRAVESDLSQGAEMIAVEPRNEFQADALRADRFAGAEHGAVAETLGVHLFDHGEDALVLFGLALREQVQVRRLGGDEQHG